MATAGQVTPTTTDTTTTTTSTTDTGTPVISQSTLGPSTVTTGGADTQQGDASGSASPGSDPGNGTLTIIVSSASDPASSGSPATSTGPPGSTTTDTTDTTPTTDTSGTTPNTVDNPPSSNSQSAQGEADTTQTGAQNGNVSTRVDHGGDTGQVTQGNNANSSATGTASSDVPATGSDPSGNAAATTNQDSPSNSNVAVRVGSPGDISGVDQTNHSSANASSSGPTGDQATGGGGNANAGATQTSPGNVNVVVRVGSPGDNGNVNQKNVVDATAGPNANAAPPAGSATSGPAQTDQVTATTNSGAGQANSGTVDQQLIQTQDGNGPDVNVTGNPAVDQAASSSTGSATATQTGAKNVNVSIRVGSPGTDGTVAQTNGANATGTSPDLSIAKVTDASNLNLSIVLPGGTAVAPGADWSWNWTWTGDGTPPAGATADAAAPTTGPNWSWLWSQTPATTAAASVATTGFFTWDWTWTMTDGTVWSLHEQQACSCNWTWTWNWDWSKGAPTSTPAGSDGTSADDGGAAPGDGSYNDGPVTQDNTVTAVADATVDLTQTGLVSVDQSGVDPSLELQDAETGQSFANTQNVIAVADAQQLHPTNLNAVWGVPVAKVSQSNFVEADAEAHATVTLDQELIQGQDGAPDTYQWVGAQQTSINDQQIAAGAQAIQDSAGNYNIVSAPAPNHAAVAAIEQANTAVTTAAANAVATLYQGLAQFEDASAGGVELTDLSQLIDSYQYSLVASTVIQTKTRNVDYLLVPAGSRATNPTVRQRNDVTASATGWNIDDLSSTAFQYQGGAADLEITSASQAINVSQSGTAYAPAVQTNLLNYATWRGVEPPLPGGDDGGDQGGDTQPVPSVTPAPAVGGLVRVYAPFTGSFVHVPQGKGHLHLVLHLLPGVVGGGIFLPPAFAEGTAPIVPRAGPAPTTQTFTPPPSGLVPAPSTGSSVVVQLQSGTTTVAAASPASPERIPAPLPPGNPDNPFSAGAGASASAPSSGGGQTAIAFGPYKLAAQLVTGPQMPASALGRPVIFLEPFERPG